MDESFARIQLFDVLTMARSRGASDIHLTADEMPFLRVDNHLELLEGLDGQDLLQALLEALDLSNALSDQLSKRGDCTTMMPRSLGLATRVHLWRQAGALSAAIRLHDTDLRSFSGLGLPDISRTLLTNASGLLLFTGPTGSGKSTSMYSSIREIATSRALHIMTIEDPIEVIFSVDKGLVQRREVGRDAPSFAASIRSAMRSDPDIIVVGEMRDPETMSAALHAAETGHLVVSTLHARSSASSIDRIIDSFPASRASEVRGRLASVLLGVINQRLLRRIGGGRVLAAECLVVNDAARTLIREAKTYQIGNLIAMGRATGMQSLAGEAERLNRDHVIENTERIA